jgi:hypothetical protein
MMKKGKISPPSKNKVFTREERLQKELEELAAEADKTAGLKLPWNIDHIPYGASAAFNKSAHIREQFEPHVNECKYCQKLIEIADNKP